MHFGLKLSHSVQYKSEYIYTVNFSEVLSDLVIMLFIEENFNSSNVAIDNIGGGRVSV